MVRRGRRIFFGLTYSFLVALCVGLIQACGDDDIEKGGILTITNFSEYDGMYVSIVADTGDPDSDGVDLEGFELTPTKRLGVKISDGQAMVPMWNIMRNGYSPYWGNHKNQILGVGIYDGASGGQQVYFGRVRADFTDGYATVDWIMRLNYFVVMEGRPQGYLTVTGLSQDYDGQYIGFSGYKYDSSDRIYGFEKQEIDYVSGYRSRYVKISGGQAKIPVAIDVYIDDSQYLKFIQPYTGNDRANLTLSRYSDVNGTEASLIRSLIVEVDFINGNATVDVSEW